MKLEELILMINDKPVTEDDMKAFYERVRKQEAVFMQQAEDMKADAEFMSRFITI